MNLTQQQQVNQALSSVRDRLLDLSMRNSLLNYRERKTCIRIIDELPRPTFTALQAGRTLEFLPAQTAGTGHELPSDDGSQVTAKRHQDRYLQTNLPADKLNAALKKVHAAAKREMEETGANILFLAMGFLCMRDDKKDYQAPLILAPVNLTRSRTRRGGKVVDSYKLAYNGDDLQTNRCLAQKLYRDYELQLPELDEDDLDPEHYFDLVRSAIHGLDGWRVAREMVVSFFSFAKLFMYLDLDPAGRSNPKSLTEHPMIRELLIGCDQPPPPIAQADHPEPRLILDADSTQLAAIQAGLHGGDMVIEGPPGTGKSQTIANLIAAALDSGKTVLFLAEKAAALEVVKRRLDQVGLGPFILELHSHKTHKRTLIDNLRTRLEIPVDELDHNTHALTDHRDRLEHHAVLMNQTYQSTGWTIYDIFWRYQQARRRQPQGQGVPLAQFTPATPDVLSKARLLVSQIAGVCAATVPPRNPWFGFDLSRYNTANSTDLAETISRMTTILASAQNRLADFWDKINAPYPPTLGHLAQLLALDRSALITWPSPMDCRLLSALLDPNRNKHLKRLCRHVDEISQQRNQRAEQIIGLEKMDEATLGGWIAQLEAARGLGDLNLNDAQRIQNHAIYLEAACTRINQSLAERSWSVFLVGRPFQEILHFQKLLNWISTTAPPALELYPAHLIFKPETRRLFKQLRKRADRLEDVRDELATHFHVTADQPMLPNLLKTLERLRHNKTRWFKREWRTAAKQVKTLFKIQPKDQAVRLQLIKRLIDLHTHQVAFENDPQAAELGGFFEGRATQWEQVTQILDWAEQLEKALPHPGLIAELELDPYQALIQIGRLHQELARETDQFEPDRFLTSYSKAHQKPALTINWQHQEGLQHLQPHLDRIRRLLDPLTTLFQDHVTTEGLQFQDLLSAAHHERAAQALTRQLEEMTVYKDVFGAGFRLHQLDPHTMNAHHHWVDTLVQTGLDNHLLEWLFQSDTESRAAMVLDLTVDLAQIRDQLNQQIQGFGRFGANPPQLLQQPHWRTVPLKNLINRFQSPTFLQAAPSWGDYCRFSAQAQALQLGPLIDMLEEGRVPGNRLMDCFNRSYLQSLALDILKTHPTLNDVNHQSLAMARSEYADLDRIRQREDADMIIQNLLARPVPAGVAVGRVGDRTEMGLIRREIAKSTRHVPIRSLLTRAGHALQALKPCFMMSPLSVAQYLQSERFQFDMVIMDEASQLRPEECLGGIARARQVIVVGDPKQMPPTSFFDNKVEDSDSPAEDLESILDFFVQSRGVGRRLSWHYRARHQDLIRFSNHHFYQDALTVFPSPNAKSPAQGVQRIHCPDAVFTKGTNPIEAQRVAAHVLEHLRTRPHLSLGVCTFNGPQRDLIEECIDALAAQSTEDLTRWRQANDGPEPLFVKNLENVQGDERDHIVISVAFGPDPETGRVYQRFGPISQAMGPRRLNVLFTRARQKMILFTSLKPDQLPKGRGPRGAQLLRSFLEYAQNPDLLQTNRSTDQEPLSPFQEILTSLLEAKGYQCRYNIGGAGSPIDVAVCHPHKPETYILGIMSEFSTFRAAKAVRDRERLQETVLIGLGWTLYRIIAVDWFKNQPSEENRLLKTLADLTAL